MVQIIITQRVKYVHTIHHNIKWHKKELNNQARSKLPGVALSPLLACQILLLQ